MEYELPFLAEFPQTEVIDGLFRFVVAKQVQLSNEIGLTGEFGRVKYARVDFRLTWSLHLSTEGQRCRLLSLSLIVSVRIRRELRVTSPFDGQCSRG